MKMTVVFETEAMFAEEFEAVKKAVKIFNRVRRFKTNRAAIEELAEWGEQIGYEVVTIFDDDDKLIELCVSHFRYNFYVTSEEV